MSQSVEHATAARKVLCPSPGYSLLFDQNLGKYLQVKNGSEKSAEACDITFASASETAICDLIEAET